MSPKNEGGYFKVQVTRKIEFVLKDRFRQFKYFRKVSPPYAKRFFSVAVIKLTAQV